MKMNKFIKQTMIAATLTASTVALAGDGVGNGGDVLICPKGIGKKQIELLDYYEARQKPRSWVIDLGKASLSRDEKVNIIIDRIEKIDPLRAEQYRKWAKEFIDDVDWRKGETLVDIPDSEHIALPTGCRKDQLVIQSEPNGITIYKRYTINQDIWDKMDADEQAGTVMHEIVYREMIADGQKNSVRARYYNGLAATTQFESITHDDYAKNVLQLTQLSQNEYFKDGNKTQVFKTPRIFKVGLNTFEAKEVRFNKDKVILAVRTSSKRQPVKFAKFYTLTVESDSMVHFYPNGAVSQVNKAHFYDENLVNVAFSYGAYIYAPDSMVPFTLFFDEAGQLDLARRKALGLSLSLLGGDDIAAAIGSQRRPRKGNQCPLGYRPIDVENRGNNLIYLSHAFGAWYGDKTVVTHIPGTGPGEGAQTHSFEINAKRTGRFCIDENERDFMTQIFTLDKYTREISAKVIDPLSTKSVEGSGTDGELFLSLKL